MVSTRAAMVKAVLRYQCLQLISDAEKAAWNSLPATLNGGFGDSGSLVSVDGK